jgi:hypothetical protein
MPSPPVPATLGSMNEMQSALARLEGRLDYQASRLDALYRMLETAGVLPRPARHGRADGFFDELFQVEESPLAREHPKPPARRRKSKLHVGNATGV